MLMRTDIAAYAKSVLTMSNFYPTLQGSAERNPGTRFASTITDDTGFPTSARIIPYLTFDNRRTLLILTEGNLAGVDNAEDLLQPVATVGAAYQAGAVDLPTTISKNRVINGSFLSGTDNWAIDPVEYTGADGGLEARFGVWSETNAIRMRAAKYKSNKTEFIETCSIVHEGTAPIDPADNPGNTVYLVCDYWYAEQYYPDAGNKQKDQYEALLNVGTTPGGSDVYQKNIKLDIGQADGVNIPIDLPAGFVLGDKLYPSFTLTAKATDNQPYSWPLFIISRLNIFANVAVTTDISETEGVVPWLADELPEVQFIQSPYDTKELVLVHPNHFPQRYYFNGVNYVIGDYPFKDGDGLDFDPWGEPGRYPATVTSFRGRLILAGGESRVSNATYQTSNTETVWGSNVAQWNLFEDNPEDINPNDSIEFTTIYRSPIKWVYGQKDLLIGAREMEYIASADGIFSPGELGVEMHSTHGSAGVQPIGFGDSVLFPAENGTKVRGMSKNTQQETGSYLAPDFTLLHPDLCRSGIKRMVRMRNPHQMAVILLGNGQLALLHQDGYAQVLGWSRFNISAPIRDVAVTTAEDGADILWLTIERRVEDSLELHLEAIYDWQGSVPDWDYLSGARTYVGPYTSVLTNLEHLEGKQVYVTGLSSPRTDGEKLPLRVTGLIGTYTVRDGQVTLKNDAGGLIEVSAAKVGMGLTATLRTLPVADTDPGASKRYNEISVRVRASTLPKMGVLSEAEAQVDAITRPPVREAIMPQNVSQVLRVFTDVELANFGWDKYQTVAIQENLPIRCEILGIYGKLKSNSV